MSQTTEVQYSLYPGETVIHDIMYIMAKTLSEQYSIYVHRYFLDVSSLFLFQLTHSLLHTFVIVRSNS